MRSVLITGGSGSFGRACVSRLLKSFDDDYCERICIFSRGELSQANMRAELADDPRLRWFIGDVRDRSRLRRAMNECDTVIHAAALKRIEVGHYNPVEMAKTNVDGAINVIEAATDAGVQKVVCLSSDKAYQPVSAYGYSKAMAESLFLAANNTRGKNGPIFAVTRYGNVSGSAGSIIPKWREALKSGKCIYVTDPDCTRFWMTMDQAVDLVLNTVKTMRGGELVIPELPAYRIIDLAIAMGAEASERIGLPAYEKKHESMREGLCSETARRMSVNELKEALASV